MCLRVWSLGSVLSVPPEQYWQDWQTACDKGSLIFPRQSGRESRKIARPIHRSVSLFRGGLGWTDPQGRVGERPALQQLAVDPGCLRAGKAMVS